MPTPHAQQPIPHDLLALLEQASPCFVATLMPDGSPQLTKTWVSTDGAHIVINIIAGLQKSRNLERDTRVAINIVDPEETDRYFAVRGHVVDTTTRGADEHLAALAQKYLGTPYPKFGAEPGERVIVTIAPEKVTPPFRG